MRLGAQALSLGVAVMLVGLSPFSSAGEKKLQHDPFARPSLGVLPHGAKPPRGPSSAAQGAQLTGKLNLQAVMVAGSDSIANVDGIIVRIGESVHGYRLVAVQERSAVFEKNNTRFAVSIRNATLKAEPARRLGAADFGSGAERSAESRDRQEGK